MDDLSKTYHGHNIDLQRTHGRYEVMIDGRQLICGRREIYTGATPEIAFKKAIERIDLLELNCKRD